MVKKTNLWIGTAKKTMEKEHTVGKFTKHAKSEGESVAKEAREVLRDPKSSAKLKKEAVFAQNMRKIAAKRKKK